MTKVSVVQMSSQDNVKDNLKKVSDLVIEAAKAGSQLVLLPENFALIGSEEQKLKNAEDAGKGLIQETIADLARNHNIWILAGSIAIKNPEAKTEKTNKVFAASILYDNNGNNVCRYDKIHLFDVTINIKSTVESYCESNTISPGHNPTVYKSPFGMIGLSICYDIRFPELYRGYCAAGVEIISIPAAFVYETGKAHWHVLNRARAIENQAYVMAANQYGAHPGNRRTYGHSMIINPWGEVIAETADKDGIITANIDLNAMRKLRASFPVIQHRKL